MADSISQRCRADESAAGHPIYRVTIQNHLPEHWSEWFNGLSITYDEHGDSILTGPVSDQSALFGLLLKIRDLGLTLIAVNRV